MLYDFGTFTSVDINECLEESLNDCDGNATCFDTDGGFNCSCNIGYTGNGTEGNCLGMAISSCRFKVCKTDLVHAMSTLDTICCKFILWLEGLR